MKYVLNAIIAWTWEIPQTLLGFLVFLGFIISFQKLGKAEWYKGRPIINFATTSWLSGSSLGYFIFLPARFLKNRNKDIKHEHGHQIQSMILGPLYLFIVGIPSVINNLRARNNRKILLTYYERYPEKWADKLGKVTR